MEDKAKEFPDNYPADAVEILETMGFSGSPIMLFGSMSLRSQQYAGDYDGFQKVRRNGSVDTVVKDLVKDFQGIIKNLQSMPVYIGDIKSGVIEEWRVLPKASRVEGKKIIGFNKLDSQKVLDALYSQKVITEAERNKASKLVDSIQTPVQFLLAKKELKFHIVRWTPNDVIQGFQHLRDGRKFTLAEAFTTPTITKLDVIGLVQNNRYTDFSMIYEFYAGKKFLNANYEDVLQTLKDDILLYKHEGNPFKVLKRQFALAKLNNNKAKLKKLTPILNSDLGRLYVIMGDVGTLLEILESHKKIKLPIVRYEIDQFKSRMANIYTLKDFLKNEHTILSDIDSALKTTSHKNMVTKLTHIKELLQKYLKDNTPVIK